LNTWWSLAVVAQGVNGMEAEVEAVYFKRQALLLRLALP
jgi:hypothetical protein